MTAPRSKPVRWRLALGAALLLFATAGCSEDAPPGESAPALAERLDEVDAAIEAGEPAKARTAVEDLIAETAQARVEGDISDEDADRIFDAAQAVLDELPDAIEKDRKGPADEKSDEDSGD